MTAPELRNSIARQAAADVAQVIRGKRWLRRVTELADSAAADRQRQHHDSAPRRHAS